MSTEKKDIPREVIEKRKAIVEGSLAYTPDDTPFNKGVRSALLHEYASLEEILEM